MNKPQDDMMKYSKALYELSSKSMNVSNLQDFLDFCMRKLGELTGVSRVYIFEVSGEHVNNTHEWVNEGVEPFKDRLQGIPIKDYPVWMSTLRSGNTIYATDIEKDLEEEVRQILKQQKIKSCLVVPLFVHDRWQGFLGFDDCKKCRVWSELEQYMLSTMAYVISTAMSRTAGKLRRKELEHDLSSAKNLLANIVESTETIIIHFDRLGHIAIWNRAAEKCTGIKAGAALGKHLTEINLDFHKSHVQVLFKSIMESGKNKRFTNNLTCADGTRKVISFVFSPVFNHGRIEGIACMGTDVTPQTYADTSLLPGNTYLVLEHNYAADVFLHQVYRGRQGLYITRSNIHNVRVRYPNSSFEHFWLDAKGDRVQYLSNIEHRVKSFVSQNNKPVVFLERADYLIGMYGFDAFLRLLYRLNSTVIESNAIMVVALNPHVIDDRQLSYIEEETQLISKIVQAGSPLSRELRGLLQYLDDKAKLGLSVSVAEVAKQFSITRPTASDRINRLIEKGLADARQSGRRKEVTLSELGREALKG
jgi:PAS domain S-box-containing protein